MWSLEYNDMAVKILRSRPGGSLSRSEIVTVRLDPKLRYFAELAARKQRRTLSSFIEWAVERGLDSIHITDGDTSLWSEADTLWDVDESDRFAKLALRHPDLLTHDEQVLWKLIRENGYVWRGRYDHEGYWRWNPADESDLNLNRLKQNWGNFKAAAAGDDEARMKLPKWTEHDATKAKASEKKGKFDDLDDDIPF